MSKVTVIGLGYVGLPSVINHSQNKHQVVGYDVNKQKVDLLRQGKSYLDTVSDQQVCQLLAAGVSFSSNLADIYGQDIYIIDVPTPIDKFKIPDMQFVQAATQLVLKVAQKGALILLESTTYPGTTEEYLVDPLRKKGWSVGEDIFVGYSPERISPGDKQSQDLQVPRVVSGYTPECLTRAMQFYGVQAHPVSSLQVAELTKLYENTFRLVNIALADELHKVADNLEISTSEVLDAAATKPFGFMKFQPSLGIGGHCIPVDPYYLSWFMEKRGVHTPLIQTAGNINDSMIPYHFEKILNRIKKQGKKITDSKVAILGGTYKENVADTRMSAMVKFYERLKAETKEVVLFDDLLTANLIEQDIPVASLLEDLRQLENFDIVLYGVNHHFYAEQKEAIRAYSNDFYDMVVV